MIATDTTEPSEVTCGVLRAIALSSIVVITAILNSHFLIF